MSSLSLIDNFSADSPSGYYYGLNCDYGEAIAMQHNIIGIVQNYVIVIRIKSLIVCEAD